MSGPETPKAGAALDVDALTVSYRQHGRPLRVLEDVSFHIRPGEAYGLVGESGCGKTTVAMALMHYLPTNAVVDGGRIAFAGHEMLTASPEELRRLRGDRMAMVYQDPGSALNPSIRVGAQIAEVYRHHRRLVKPAAMSAAREMLTRVQISDPDRVARRYPHELSGGQQQRVMIAMALATDPDLLVLDEPTTGLDATVEAEVLDLVERLRAELGASILFISHNLGIVARICDRVGVLYAGRIVEQGPARELFASPRHPYTLALVRCVPRPGMHKTTRRLDPIPGYLPLLGADIPGCVFADRCQIVRERCRVEPPALEPVTPAHSARCHFHDEVSAIAPGVQAAATPGATPATESLLEVRDLVKTYRSQAGETTAVAGVSFEVRRGEIFGLVGESGSGKTSLARCVVGLFDCTSGTIVIDGVELSGRGRPRDRDLRRKLQMVFQNPDSALNPKRSVRRLLGRSVRVLAGVRGGAQIDKRVRELAESTRLQPRHLGLRPPALSGGLKQRVAIAAALAGQPELVVCDEPVSALDVSVQAAILNLLVDLQARNGLSYIFISHDLAVVRYVADRIGVMYLGQLVEVGSAEAVFSPPHHPYTEALASATPSLDAHGPRKRIRLQGTIPNPSDPPSGCRFHTRCPRYLGDQCHLQEPPWQRDSDGHRYRCHIPPDELRDAQIAPAAGSAGRIDVTHHQVP